MAVPGWDKPFFKYVVRDSWSRANAIASAGGGIVLFLVALFLLNGRGETMLSREELVRAVEIALIGFGAIWLVIMICRAFWWPFSQFLERRGGLLSFLRLNLGSNMWPVILMALGGGFFVVSMLSFGAGLIWFAINTTTANVSTTGGASATNSPPANSASAPNKPVVLAYEVEGRIKALDQLHEALEKSGETLFQRIHALDLPWTTLPWQMPRKFRGRQPQPPVTVETIKATLPQINEIVGLNQRMIGDINAVIKYPYEKYLRDLTGGKIVVFDQLNSSDLIRTILSLKPDENEDYMMLLLNQQSKPFIDRLKQFTEWFQQTKRKISAEREAQLALVPQAAR